MFSSTEPRMLIECWGAGPAAGCVMYRAPRREDLDTIRELRAALADKSARADTLQRHRADLEARLQQLQGELLLRESNYNRTFANGGAGARALDVGSAMTAEQSVAKWMLKPGGSLSRKGSESRRSQRGGLRE